MSKENYFKDVKKSTFYFDRTPFAVVGFLLAFGTYIMLFVVLHILLEENFVIEDYIFRKLRQIDTIGASLFGIYGFISMNRKEYHIMVEKPFASISNERLVLNFGRDSFLWDTIQSVILEGERKLTVIYNDKRKTKRKINDLKWLSKKEDFIYNLKNNCSTRDIPYREVDMTHSSQIVFYLIIMKRFLFEPYLTKE